MCILDSKNEGAGNIKVFNIVSGLRESHSLVAEGGREHKSYRRNAQGHGKSTTGVEGRGKPWFRGALRTHKD